MKLIKAQLLLRSVPEAAALDIPLVISNKPQSMVLSFGLIMAEIYCPSSIPVTTLKKTIAPPIFITTATAFSIAAGKTSESLQPSIALEYWQEQFFLLNNVKRSTSILAVP